MLHRPTAASVSAVAAAAAATGMTATGAAERAAAEGAAGVGGATEGAALVATTVVYNPPTPPRSPLLIVETFLPYSRRHPKAAPKPGQELSPREWALSLNPYGELLPPVPSVPSVPSVNPAIGK